MTRAEDLEAARRGEPLPINVEEASAIELRPNALVVLQTPDQLTRDAHARLVEAWREALEPTRAKGIVLEGGVTLAGVLEAKAFAADEILAAALEEHGRVEVKGTAERLGLLVEYDGQSYTVEWETGTLELEAGRRPKSVCRYLVLEDAARAAVEGPPAGLVSFNREGGV